MHYIRLHKGWLLAKYDRRLVHIIEGGDTEKVTRF